MKSLTIIPVDPFEARELADVAFVERRLPSTPTPKSVITRRAEARRQVDLAVSELDADMREVFFAWFDEGTEQSFRTVAERLGLCDLIADAPGEIEAAARQAEQMVEALVKALGRPLRTSALERRRLATGITLGVPSPQEREDAMATLSLSYGMEHPHREVRAACHRARLSGGDVRRAAIAARDVLLRVEEHVLQGEPHPDAVAATRSRERAAAKAAKAKRVARGARRAKKKS